MARKYKRKKMKDNETRIEFKVIDNNTGKEADIGKIALKEDWAKGLMYCDMQGFAILDDGNLILLDECGKFEYCPSERFSIMFEDSIVLSMEEFSKALTDNFNMGKKEAQFYSERVAIPTTRKETAEKILRDLYSEATSNVSETVELTTFQIEQLAKQFGVEIKE